MRLTLAWVLAASIFSASPLLAAEVRLDDKALDFVIAGNTVVSADLAVMPFTSAEPSLSQLGSSLELILRQLRGLSPNESDQPTGALRIIGILVGFAEPLPDDR